MIWFLVVWFGIGVWMPLVYIFVENVCEDKVEFELSDFVTMFALFIFGPISIIIAGIIFTEGAGWAKMGKKFRIRWPDFKLDLSRWLD